MKPLPVLLSIPHGGPEVPELVKDRVSITPHDLHDDIDPYTREIYDLGGRVAVVVSTECPRTIVDLNRAPDDRPPENPDGVVKSTTCTGRPIYRPGKEPAEPLIGEMLDRYYHPYHRRLAEALRTPGLEIAFDCHSMLPAGPLIAPDSGARRPSICLGSLQGRACPPELAIRFADCCRESFGLPPGEVTVDRPFAGGYITRTYGGRPLPWIQVELNRSLYLSPPHFDPEALRMDSGRLAELKENFRRALEVFLERA